MNLFALSYFVFAVNAVTQRKLAAARFFLFFEAVVVAIMNDSRLLRSLSPYMSLTLSLFISTLADYFPVCIFCL